VSIGIDWNSARVHPDGPSLVVQLTDELPEGWRDEFDNLAQLRNAEKSGPWRAISLSSRDLIHVAEVEPGAVDSLKAELNALVDQANRSLETQRTRLDEKQEAAEQEREEKERLGRDMEQRFRQG
jgi:hypothetical protein